MNPHVYLVLTVIGDDRPGLIGELSALISTHQGNWLESSMSQLAGKFAGIVKVGMDMPHAEMLKASLDMLAGLKVTAEISVPPATSQMHRMMLSLVGHDRIGIVREITQALARHAVNVEKLTTFISSAPMSAESLFNAQALLQLPVALDPRTLACELEKISDDLMVELSISEE